jgi:dihydroorotase
MPLAEVVRRSTVEPARVVRRPELGTLSPGSEADVALFRLEEGSFGFVDSGHARMKGRRRLQPALTVRAGQIVWDPDGLSWPDWETAGPYDVIR